MTETATAPSASPLPPWRRVLAVVAHPDDESFALGALLDRFADEGSEVAVLCLTRGEASTLGADEDDLPAVRDVELRAAAAELGVSRTTLLSHPDGRLDEVRRPAIEADIEAEVADVAPDGILVFDPEAGVTGHSDHAEASRAALAVARRHGIPVLGWALPQLVSATINAEYGAAFAGYPTDQLVTVPVARARQRRAIRQHASQAVPGSVLWRRLELLGEVEHVHLL